MRDAEKELVNALAEVVEHTSTEAYYGLRNVVDPSRHYTYTSVTLAEAVVRQARKGMVPASFRGVDPEFKVQYENLADENARLRAELETAHNTGAREALTRLAGSAEVADYGEVVRWRDREYPAPAVADTGEREAVPERFDAEVLSFVGGSVGYLPITPDLARRIVAMGGGK